MKYKYTTVYIHFTWQQNDNKYPNTVRMTHIFHISGRRHPWLNVFVRENARFIWWNVLWWPANYDTSVCQNKIAKQQMTNHTSWCNRCKCVNVLIDFSFVPHSHWTPLQNKNKNKNRSNENAFSIYSFVCFYFLIFYLVSLIKYYTRHDHSLSKPDNACNIFFVWF